MYGFGWAPGEIIFSRLGLGPAQALGPIGSWAHGPSAHAPMAWGGGALCP